MVRLIGERQVYVSVVLGDGPKLGRAHRLGREPSQEALPPTNEVRLRKFDEDLCLRAHRRYEGMRPAAPEHRDLRTAWHRLFVIRSPPCPVKLAVVRLPLRPSRSVFLRVPVKPRTEDSFEGLE